MKPLLAILIPSTPDRQRLLDRVMLQLDEQRKGHDCIVIINEDNYQKTTGRKRNELLDAAREQNASHIAFVDSDDLIGPNYIARNMEGVNGDYDVNELWGQYWENDKQMMPFHHSVIHSKWWQDDKAYYRMPNHLSTVKLSHLSDIRFQDKTIGEDFWYSEDMRLSGKLVKQYPINEITYYYFKNGNTNNHPMMTAKRGTNIW
jgi:hypothetical protein